MTLLSGTDMPLSEIAPGRWNRGSESLQPPISTACRNVATRLPLALVVMYLAEGAIDHLDFNRGTWWPTNH